MYQLIEERSAAEIAAIVRSIQSSFPLKKRIYIPPIEEQPSAEKCESLSPVLNETAVGASTKEPINESAPTIPIKSTSGRVNKRPRPAVPESNEAINFKNDVQKLSTSSKRSKNTRNRKDVIHPAKRLKTEPACNEKQSKVTEKNSSNASSKKNKSSSKLKHDLFNTNIIEVIQSDNVRHSRLFEAAYELQNCTTPNASVEFQNRAVENLRAQKAEIDAKRNQFTMNCSSKTKELMQKFRKIKNREEVYNEFTSKFGPTKCAEWKPFTENANRSTDISNYRALQMTKKPFIKFWIDQFLTQNCGKEKVRSMLIEIIKLLPNRPEIRNEFIRSRLPKLVAAHKRAIKKNKGPPAKCEIVDIDAALSALLDN